MAKKQNREEMRKVNIILISTDGEMPCMQTDEFAEHNWSSKGD